MNYQEADLKLQSRCRESRKIANNTYLKRRRNDELAVRLHNTDILTFHKDGRIELYTAGWNTVTTRGRMNEFLPKGWSVWSEHNYMFIGRGGWGNAIAAFTGYGVTIENDGTVSGGIAADEMRRRIKDELNEARRPVNRARYWLRKARGIYRDSSGCNGKWCRCHPRGGWHRRSTVQTQVGVCECGCKFIHKPASVGKLTVGNILSEQNQTVRAAMISIYGMERFILDAGATMIEERGGYQLLEIKFSNQWRDRIKALKMRCPSTGAVYINTVPPDIETVESGLKFMFNLPDGVNYFTDVVQHA